MNLISVFISPFAYVNRFNFIKNPFIDFGTALAATVVLILFGAIAGYIPAKRASRIKPIVALRDE